MKKLLFNICAGDVAQRQYAVSGECFREYAKRHGYDYHCITDVEGYKEPHYAKTYALKAIQDGYECVVYFDVDGVINIDAPDIAVGKCDGLWLYNELDIVESYHRNTAIRDTFHDYCKHRDLKWDGKYYFNTGVFVLFPDAVELLDITDMEPGRWCHEQHCINFNIVKRPDLMRFLPSRWNYHRLQFPDRMECARRGEPWFSHFAGAWCRGKDHGVSAMQFVKDRYKQLAEMPSQIDRPWEVFNPPAVEVVSNRCCMVTVAIGDKLKWMFDITLASQKAYCERHGITHIIVDETWRRGNEHPCMMKQRAYDLLATKQFDRACYADADIWMSPDAPNIFDEVPRGKLGQYEEGCHWRPNVLGDLFVDFADYAEHYNERMDDLGLETIDIEKWDGKYYNAGLFVCDLETCPHIPPVGGVMHLPHRKRLARGGDFYDQHYVNLMRVKHDIPIHQLSARWDMFRGMLDAMPYKIKDCYFIHYCGDEAQKRKILTDAKELKTIEMVDKCNTAGTLNVNFVMDTNQGWILDKFTQQITSYVPDSVVHTFGQHVATGANAVNVFIPYRKYVSDTGQAKSVVLFTHPGDMERWDASLRCDIAIVMNEQYKQQLIDSGMSEDRIHNINFGVDDVYRDCRLRIFNPSKVARTNEYMSRKGWDEWKCLQECDWLDCKRSEGLLTQEQMVAEYKMADAIVSTATLEGGPMACLEALAMGKVYIGREGVGLHDEHRKDIYRYKDYDGLVMLLRQMYEHKQQRARAVMANQWPLCAQQVWSAIGAAVGDVLVCGTPKPVADVNEPEHVEQAKSEDRPTKRRIGLHR